MSDTIKLQTASILNAPFNNYEKDFTFIVNGERFQTSRFIADVLSTKISKIHSTDPTFNEFSINIKEKGNFATILNLIHFNTINIPEKETLFILKILQILEVESIDIHLLENEVEITLDTVFDRVYKHEQYKNYYVEHLNKEIDFISEHFFEIEENLKEELEKLSLETLLKIIDNPKLHLKNEDQLLGIINSLYSKDQRYSVLYEHVLFSNAEQNVIDEFLQIFDINDITNETWKLLSLLIKKKSSQQKSCRDMDRYNSQTKLRIPILYEEEKEFDGILKYLHSESNGNISNLVDISSSSVFNESFNPCNVVAYDDKSKYFLSDNQPNSCICFDFKQKHVIPTNYTIRSGSYKNGAHPRSWVIEGSNDNKHWDTIDTQNNCLYLNGLSNVYTFSIQEGNSKDFRYIRMRQTDQSYAMNHYLRIEAFEIYGVII